MEHLGELGHLGELQQFTAPLCASLQDAFMSVLYAHGVTKSDGKQNLLHNVYRSMPSKCSEEKRPEARLSCWSSRSLNLEHGEGKSKPMRFFDESKASRTKRSCRTQYFSFID